MNTVKSHDYHNRIAGLIPAKLKLPSKATDAAWSHLTSHIRLGLA